MYEETVYYNVCIYVGGVENNLEKFEQNTHCDGEEKGFFFKFL